MGKRGDRVKSRGQSRSLLVLFFLYIKEIIEYLFIHSRASIILRELDNKIEENALKIIYFIESKKEKRRILSICEWLFFLGIIIFIVGIFFNNALSYLLGIVFISFSLLVLNFRRCEKKKIIKARKEFTNTNKAIFGAVFLIGSFFAVSGLGKRHTLYFMAGILLMCSSIIYSQIKVSLDKKAIDKAVDISFGIFLIISISALINEVIGLKTFLSIVIGFMKRYDILLFWSIAAISLISVLFYRLFNARIRQRSLERFMAIAFDMFLAIGIISFLYELARSSHIITVTEGYETWTLFWTVIAISFGVIVARIFQYRRFDKRVLRKFMNLFIGSIIIASSIFLIYEVMTEAFKKEVIGYLPSLVIIGMISVFGGFLYYKMFNKIEITKAKKILYFIIFILGILLIYYSITQNMPLALLTGILCACFVIYSYRTNKKAQPVKPKRKFFKLKIIKEKGSAAKKVEKIEPAKFKRLLPALIFIAGMFLLISGLFVKKLTLTIIGAAVLVLDILISLRKPKNKGIAEKTVHRKALKKTKVIKVNPIKMISVGFLIITLAIFFTGLIAKNNPVVLLSLVILALDILLIFAAFKFKFAKKKEQKYMTEMTRGKKATYITLFIICLGVLFYLMLRYQATMFAAGVMVLLGVFVSLILIFKKERKKLADTVKIEGVRITKEHHIEFQTDLDRLYEEVQKNGTIKVSRAAAQFKVSNEVAEQWGLILEEKGLVNVIYPPVGFPIIKKAEGEKHDSV